MARPSIPIAEVPTASIVNPKVMANAKGDDLGSRWLATNSAGSGHYLMARFDKGRQVVLTPNPYAAKPPAFFREVNFLIVKDDATRAIQLATGGLDIVDPLPAAVDEWMRGRAGRSLDPAERRELQGIRYNFAQPTFFNFASMTREGS